MRLALGLIVAALALAAPASSAREAVRIDVYAAASLARVLPAIDRRPAYSFGGSDQLAFQIREGAPADVYAAAAPKHPRLLHADGLVYRPVVFATNALVVIVPRANPARIRRVFDLRRNGTKVVIGERGVPIGDYTRRALSKLGIADDVSRNVVSEETDVRGIVAKVALGEADAGIVYRTDARTARSRVRTVPIPEYAQPSIRYELAVVRRTKRLAAAQAFVRRVLGPAGRRRLAAAGFGLPRPSNR